MTPVRITSTRIICSITLTSLLLGMTAPVLLLPRLILAQEAPLPGQVSGPFDTSIPGSVTIEKVSPGTPVGPTSCITGAVSAAGVSLAAAAAGTLPVFDLLNLGSNVTNCIQTALGAIAGTVTSGGIGYLVGKSKADFIQTLILKSIVRIGRDMVIRWIVTGRFGGPVFSQSFSVDLRKSAENASRIFLSDLSGINFCAGFEIPPQAFFGVDIRDLECTFPGNRANFGAGEFSDFVSLASSEDGANEYWNAVVMALDKKLQAEAVAQQAFEREYQAGEGFLGIRDEVTGLVKIPGSYAKTLVEQTNIVGPQRTVDVAQTVQQALDAIILTAIQVSIEKGLSGAFKPTR